MLTKGTSVRYNRAKTNQKVPGTFLTSQYAVLRDQQRRQESYLEWMAAILGLNLTLSFIAALNIPIANAQFWSGSMDVLCWIRGRGRQFQPFVANRIGEIQGQSSPEQWQYIESKGNPADVCSRGLRTCSLMESHLWWNGPQFLLKAENDWPRMKIEEGSEARTEARKTFLSSQPRCFV